MSAEWETSFLADVNQNIRIVHRVCHTYFPRDAMEREEVFQDIMYQLWKSYPRFNGESNFSTWMHKVALNTAITHILQSTRNPANTDSIQPIHQAPDMHDHIHRQRAI